MHWILKPVLVALFVLSSAFSAGICAEGDSELLPILQHEPLYPAEALMKCLAGTVVLEFTVTARGNVENIEVVRSDHDGLFDQAAIDAVARWRFKPRIIAGEAVAARATIPIQFEQRECSDEQAKEPRESNPHENQVMSHAKH